MILFLSSYVQNPKFWLFWLQVAIICNHQRSVSKSHSQQMSRLNEKISELQVMTICLVKGIHGLFCFVNKCQYQPSYWGSSTLDINRFINIHVNIQTHLKRLWKFKVEVNWSFYDFMPMNSCSNHISFSCESKVEGHGFKTHWVCNFLM